MSKKTESSLRIASYTLGCKLNQAETESLVSSFKQEGFTIVPFSEEADIVIVNTCTVTSKSEQKGRRSIRNCAKHYPETPIIVTGCYAQLDPDVLQSLASNVFVVSGDDKARIVGLPKALKLAKKEGSSFFNAISEYFSTGFLDSGIEFTPFIYTPTKGSTRSRAFLKIQDGCNFACSFCRVSPARGSSVSLSTDLVLKRLITIKNEGFNEVVLTGVNLCCYNSGDISWAGLLNEIENDPRLKGLRIRLSSLSAEYLSPENIDFLKGESLMPHFHISIQAGSNKVLKLMRRRHSFEDVVVGVERLREIKDDPFIGADIIVGFPGEAEEDFDKTMELINIIKPAHLHIFPYSERPGTEAFNFGNKVPQRVAKERITKLTVIAEKYRIEYLKRWEGKDLELLIEEKAGKFSATTRHYIQGLIEEKGNLKADLISGEMRSGKFKLLNDQPVFSIKTQ